MTGLQVVPWGSAAVILRHSSNPHSHSQHAAFILQSHDNGDDDAYKFTTKVWSSFIIKMLMDDDVLFPDGFNE